MNLILVPSNENGKRKLSAVVTVLVNHELAAGSYTVHFDGSSLSSGIYVYRIVAGDHVDSKKMILVK